MGGGDIHVQRTDPGQSDPEPDRTGAEWGAVRVRGVLEALIAGLGGRQGSWEDQGFGRHRGCGVKLEILSTGKD